MSKNRQPKADKGKLARRVARLEDAHRRDLIRLKKEMLSAVALLLNEHERAYHDEG